MRKKSGCTPSYASLLNGKKEVVRSRKQVSSESQGSSPQLSEWANKSGGTKGSCRNECIKERRSQQFTVIYRFATLGPRGDEAPHLRAVCQGKRSMSRLASSPTFVLVMTLRADWRTWARTCTRGRRRAGQARDGAERARRLRPGSADMGTEAGNIAAGAW